MFSKSPYNRRNIIIKTIITLHCALGTCFAIFSTVSCQWFEFSQEELTADAWNVVPDKNTTFSMGLFRYQTTTQSNTCFPYDPLFVGNRFSMLFAAQVCVILGPILAFVAWLFAIVAVSKQPTTFFLLLATSVQCFGVIASMQWCKEFWECPWLFGSVSNGIAAIFFFLSFFLSMLGLVKEEQEEIDSASSEKWGDERPSIIDVSSYSSSNDNESLQSDVTKESKFPTTASKASRAVSVITHNTGEMTAEEILMTNNRIILNAARQRLQGMQKNAESCTLKKRREDKLIMSCNDMKDQPCTARNEEP